ncbi:hypothetical protein [Pandoraea sp. NPDC087047]|uniref:hypothetical protein n=1 Tax=Pandoraea sp. NPDC087047 TaxID=3364390 RepID=UPI00382D8348
MTVLSFKRYPSAEIITSHGKITIEPLNATETLFELLSRSNIPWSAVSVFSVDEKSTSTALANLDVSFGELAEAAVVQVHFSRNVNPRMFDVMDYVRAPAEDGREVSSFVFQSIDNKASRVKNVLKGLSQKECQDIVSRNVHEFILEHVAPNSKLVIGVSGGGDSNALLMALTSFSDFSIEIHPVILKGVADWNSGVPRAQELCQSYGLELMVVEESRVREICKLRGQGDLIQSYESSFPGDDFEFLGTFMIRRVLSALAADLGAFVVTGLNLEDVLAESLYRIAQGRFPFPFPVRAIQDAQFLYPLWMCPKKIIDGCFPKFSMENYEMRYPCFSVGRNLYYMMAYSIQSAFPGAVENLLHGFRALASGVETSFHADAETGIVYEEQASKELMEKFSRLLMRNH